MLPSVLERVVTFPTMMFDAVDCYASELGLRGENPRPFEPLRFWLIGTLGAGGTPVPYPHPYEMVMVRNPGGHHLFFGKVIPYGSTRPIRRSFAEGTYIVRVTSEMGRVMRVAKPEPGKITSLFYQYVEVADVVLTTLAPGVIGMEGPRVLEMQPGYLYPFPASVPVAPDPQGSCPTNPATGQFGPTLLRGELHRADGTGIQGATISAPGGEGSYQTDSSGNWVLVFTDDPSTQPPTVPPTGQVTVTMDTPDWGVLHLAGVCVLRGCETSLPEMALRGWALLRGRPVSGAKVQVTGLAQLVEVLTQADGGWKVYFQPDLSAQPLTVTVTLPDGNFLRQNVTIHPRKTVLVPTFQFS